jgi:hypothetical protein
MNNNNAILYPTICEGNSSYLIDSHIGSIRNLVSRATQYVKDDDEVAYLEEVHKLLETEYLKNKKLIESKKQIATQHRNLDLEKVKKLPYDIIYNIKEYLAPELEYVRKFGVLRQLSFNWSQYLCPSTYLEAKYLFDVPKEIIIQLINSLCIGCSMNMKHGDNKERWLRMLVEEVDEIIGNRKYIMRTDKLLVNHRQEYSCSHRKRIDKWYSFWLNIIVFKKYRKELEKKKAENTDKLKILKNKNIIINK